MRSDSNFRTALAFLAMFFLSLATLPAQTPTFTQTIVFGDSLSDDGNVRHVMEDQ
jgi:phospholipase/lecithinase/hemolysin